jgi:hypothetical protein
MLGRLICATWGQMYFNDKGWGRDMDPTGSLRRTPTSV